MKSWAAILICVFALAFSCQSNLRAAIQTSPTIQASVEEESRKLEGEEKERAIQLVRQLGSADFEARQNATRELWSIGSPAIDLLENTAKASLSREARVRAKDLVSLIKVGLNPDADPEIIECVVGFLDREYLVQKRSIIKLVHLQKRDVAAKLIELVPSKSERESLFKLCSRGLSELELLLLQNRDDEFRALINEPTMRDSQKLFYHYCLWVDGKLDDEIERLKIEAKAEIEEAAQYDKSIEKTKKAKPANAKKKKDDSTRPPKQNRLKTLVGLLRFLERWDQALEWADKVYSRKSRKDLTHSILIESGNWKGLAGLILDPDDENDKAEDGSEELPHNGLGYPAEGYKKALIEFYAGEEEAFQATISEIEKGIEEEFQKKKRKGAKPKRSNQKHAQFLRYALDFERALKYTSLEKDRATFNMLRTHHRYEELLDVFNLQSFEKRAKYFKGRARHLRSLQSQIEWFIKENDEEKRELYVAKRDTVVSDWRLTCSLLAELGFNEEAEVYTRQLFFDMRDKVSLGHSTVQDLVGMNACESAWECARLECERDPNFAPVAALLSPQGYSHAAALLLDLHFKKKIKDRIERCRKVASLVRSPTVPDQPDIDFWEEVAEVDLSVKAESVWQLFLIWDVKEQELVRRSSGEEKKLVQDMEDPDELLQAAQKFEAQAAVDENKTTSMSNYARAWYAYSRGGDPDKAWRMRLLFAMKFEADSAYDYTSSYGGTSWQFLPFDMFRLYDCLSYDQLGSNCYYMWKMTENDSKAVINANQKMVRAQIVRLRYIDSPYFDNSENDHPTFIEGAIRSGDMESARRWFKKISDFEPANSGFVEKNFPVFEKVGNDEFLDEMFQKVSADFYAILGKFPDSAIHLNNYAWACASAKRNVKNGIEIAKRAIELRPGVAGHRDTLAELYHVDGQHDKAIETIRKAIQINPMKGNYITQLKKFQKAAKAAQAGG